VQLDKGELAGSVDGDEHKQLALVGPDFGDVDVDVDVKVTDRAGFELCPGRCLSINIGQAANVVTLKKPVQR